MKLATDVVTGVAALALAWEGLLSAAIVVGFVPPILASVLLVARADLRPYANSALGRYVARSMTPGLQLVRLAGFVVALVGAVRHEPAFVAIGLFAILLAWLRGVILPAAR